DLPGYDAGKKVKGKKRHILVDTQGLLMHAIVHAADVQDRDGGIWLLTTLFGLYPFDEALCRCRLPGTAVPVRAQEGSQARRARDRQALGSSKGVRRLAQALDRGAHLRMAGRCRRLAKDWENLNHRALAFLRLASI